MIYRVVLESVRTARQLLSMLMLLMCSQWTPAYPGEELEQIKKTLFVRSVRALVSHWCPVRASAAAPFIWSVWA